MERLLLWGLQTGIFLILLMPLIVSTNTIFPYIVGKALWARSLIEVIFALWLILAWRYPQYRPPRSYILAAFLVYLVVALLAGLFGVSLTHSLWSNYERMQGIIDLAHWFIFVLILASVLKTSAQWRPVLNFNLGVSLIVSTLGLGQHYGVRLLPYLEKTGRVDITLGSPGFAGAYLLVNFFVAVALLADSFQPRPLPPARRRRRRERDEIGLERRFLYCWRTFWAVTAGLDLWVLTLTATRGTFAGLMAGLVVAGLVYIIWGRRPALKWAFAGLLIMVLVLASALLAFKDTQPVRKLASSNVLVERLVTTRPGLGMDPGRVGAAQVGLRAFTARPVLGWGPENFSMAFDQVAPAEVFAHPQGFARDGNYFDQAHAKPVEELTTKGVLGFLAYMSLWGLLFWVLIRRATKGRPQEELFIFGMVGALAGYFVQNLFLFDTPAPLLQLMLLTGWAASMEAGAIFALPSRVFARVSLTKPAITAPFLLLPLIVSAGMSIYFLNYRPYQSARAMHLVTAETDLKLLPWNRRIALAQQAFSQSPYLANLPRWFFFGFASDNWNSLRPAQSSAILGLADLEGQKGLKAEPKNVRLYISLVSLYQKAAPSDPVYLRPAAAYIQEAKRLAPHRSQVQGLLEEQTRLETIPAK